MNNELIKQLMTQAGFDPVAIERMGVMPNADKFAELIVRECASLTLDCNNPSADYYHGWLDYRDEILKHFGIES
jgi:hypothetical protein